MKKTLKYWTFGLALAFSGSGFSQLANGSTAPDFTLTDINGNTHTLSDYLNSGKTVYIDFFACHCPYCWNYHNTHALADLYNDYGPTTASNDVFVFAIELDPNNGNNEFYGISGITQGNWVAGTNYPQINPEGAQRDSIISAFAVNYYPMIYAICPDGKITEIGKKTTAELYAHAGTCESTLGVQENKQQNFSVDQGQSEITVHSPIDLTDSNAVIVLSDLQGKRISNKSFTGKTGSIDFDHVKQSVYFIQVIQRERILFSQKIQL